MIETGTVLQERYLIEKQIGEGGMGAVYLAVDQRFNNYVAIKETFYKDDEFGEAFEREANLLNGLMHPVLPHVSDYFTEGDEHFIVMQYVEGEDVSAFLKREGRFHFEDVMRWTESLLDALDYLHSLEPPIIHRDLKPQNLKLTPRGDIILLDFGLAKINYEDTTGVKSVFGYSRKYSPLEQIQGTGTDARSDLFALAATVYHLLTGRPPLDAITRASAIVAGNPDPLEPANEVNPEVPEGVANVLHAALALNAAGRFVSAEAMRQALKHAVAGPDEHAEIPVTAAPSDETAPKTVLSYAESLKQALRPVALEEPPVTADGPFREAGFAGGKVLTYAEMMEQALKREAAREEAREEDNDVQKPENVAVAAPAAAYPVIYSPETEDFPALAAFAETSEGAAEEDKAGGTVIEEYPEADIPAAKPMAKPVPVAAAETTDVLTRISRRPNRFSRPLATLAALLLIVGFASAFYLIRNQRAAESVAKPAESTGPAESASSEVVTTSARPETVAEKDMPEILETFAPESVTKPTRKPAPNRKNIEKAESAAMPVIEETVAEKPKPRPLPSSNRRSTPNPQVSRGQSRERIIETNSVPDIESIFTGQPAWRREEKVRRREDRRRMRDEMTEEEFREMRRERRARRRQNSYPIPF